MPARPLFFIHGAPATGKYTVGAELARLIEYPFLHNHLVVEPVRALYRIGTPPYNDMYNALTLKLVEHYGANGQSGLVMTYCYARGDDDNFVNELFLRAASSGLECRPVFLYCDQSQQHQRVLALGRKAMRKISSIEVLDESMSRYNFTAIEHADTLSIDTTTVSPSSAATRVIKCANIELPAAERISS